MNPHSIQDIRSTFKNVGGQFKDTIQKISKHFVTKMDKFYRNSMSELKECLQRIEEIDDEGQVASVIKIFQQQFKEKIDSISILENYLNAYEFMGQIKDIESLIMNKKQGKSQDKVVNRSQSVIQIQEQQSQLQETQEMVVELPDQQTKIGRQNCFICFKKFDCALNLANHLKEFHTNTIVAQDAKIQQFKNAQSVIEYKEESRVQYTCCHCQKIIQGVFWDYRIHLRVYHDEQEWFKCPICLTLYIKAYDLSKHIKYHHTRKVHRQRFVYDCVFTQKQFSSAKELERNITKTIEYHKQAPDKVRYIER